MRITVEREQLFDRLQVVGRVASTRSAIQALSGVQMVVAGSLCELRATDMEVSLRVPMKAEIEREGEVVLPARLLVDVVRSLPSAPVSLELRSAEQDVELICGRATFHIRTLRAEDFPPFPDPDPDTEIAVPTKAFVATALKVAGSASRDETRPVLTGVLVSAAERELRMVATDSYRLSLKETVLDRPLAKSFEVNVPARALQELARLAAQSDEEQLRIGVRGSQILFILGGVVLSSRLLEGQFPNYRQLLPESFEHELRLDSRELGEVVRRISQLAQKNAPLRLSFTPGELTISAQTPDVGEARESLPVPFQGEPFEIGFNPDFLRSGIEAVEGGEMVLKLISPLRPGMIESVDEGRFVYLVMPIRLNV